MTCPGRDRKEIRIIISSLYIVLLLYYDWYTTPNDAIKAVVPNPVVVNLFDSQSIFFYRSRPVTALFAEKKKHQFFNVF